MMKNNYDLLVKYIVDNNEDRYTLSYDDISNIMGGMSESMYLYSTLWAKSSKLAKMLNKYGYTFTCHMSRKIVDFYKTDLIIDANYDTSKKLDTILTIRQSNINIDDAIKSIRAYQHEINIDEHARFMSWVHCYNAFKSLRKDKSDNTIDYLSLHLSNYLGSWGMFRASFLMQKDYRVHINIVKEILKDKYDVLLGISAEDLIKQENLELINELSKNIIEIYKNEKPAKKGKKNHATDTLITKIILGTLGCTPAYDSYYKKSVAKYNISSAIYNSKSLKDAANWYIANKPQFEKVREDIKNVSGIDYPPMKLVDMAMWQLNKEIK